MSTNNIDAITQISTVCGPLQLLIYLGLVVIVFRAGDKTAKRRWRTIVLIYGLFTLVISVLGPILYITLRNDYSQPINPFSNGKDLMESLPSRLMYFLCQATFIGNFNKIFKNWTPWFLETWKFVFTKSETQQ